MLELLFARDVQGRANNFDVSCVSGAIVFAIQSARAHIEAAQRPYGLFDLGSGNAATTQPDAVAVTVLRGARPDLAAGALPIVTAPTPRVADGADHGGAGQNENMAGALPYLPMCSWTAHPAEVCLGLCEIGQSMVTRHGQADAAE
ncbi:hypothetical protein KX928_03340 [Roseobacter sp. YSTF-M11]|uniref:Uncharacterized protein n=1 Tax=Roseobacter insulae TaxID=2859783 RepID=A0A9X1JX37_9RHOB|nr:hypothetical protein [Roseobacter insulae]MBW4706815.1 hypothetical protein [Roseobacter insulae]